MIDLRCSLRVNGLWRQCILCSQWFRITPSKATIEYGKVHDGERRIIRYQPGDGYPRNLMQVQCGACPVISSLERDRDAS